MRNGRIDLENIARERQRLDREENVRRSETIEQKYQRLLEGCEELAERWAENWEWQAGACADHLNELLYEIEGPKNPAG
jgi:hypothetical protein